MAGGAAPEIPVLGAAAIGLAFLLAWLACRGLLAAYRHTLGYVLEKLAGVLKFSTRVGSIDFGGPIRALDNAIIGTLAAGARKSEHGMGLFFHAAAVMQEWALRELRHFAHETLGWATWLQEVHLPRWARWAVLAAFPPALLYRLIRSAVRGELPHLVRTVRVEVKQAGAVITQRISLPYLGQWQWIHRHWRALTRAVALAGTLPLAGAFPWLHVLPRLKAIERWEGLTRKRLRRLEALLGVTGLAVALANVLGLPSWRCLTRGNIGRTARALCGIPVNLLEDLLGLIADFVILADICQVVGWLEEGLKVIEPELTALVVAADMALCGGDYNPPPAFALAPLTETPLQVSFGIG